MKYPFEQTYNFVPAVGSKSIQRQNSQQQFSPEILDFIKTLNANKKRHLLVDDFNQALVKAKLTLGDVKKSITKTEILIALVSEIRNSSTRHRLLVHFFSSNDKGMIKKSSGDLGLGGDFLRIITSPDDLSRLLDTLPEYEGHLLSKSLNNSAYIQALDTPMYEQEKLPLSLKRKPDFEKTLSPAKKPKGEVGRAASPYNPDFFSRPVSEETFSEWPFEIDMDTSDTYLANFKTR